jgi:[glutamine synthetase] adenylyltransferase / [glutamine synthetase]-adenylyl-L-tyrosine phosphorylase
MNAQGRLLQEEIESFSPYLTYSLRRQPDLAESLLGRGGYLIKKPHGQMAQELYEQMEGIADFSVFCSRLRQFKQAAILRIAARDLGGIAGLKETTADISALAQFCLQETIRFCLEKEAVLKAAQKAELEAGLVVLGLGKLGGQELNFSSDVDLIFLYQPLQTGLLSPLEQKEIFQNMTRKVIQAMGAQIEGDHVFRMDLGLRPGGKDSDLVLSVDSSLEYYQSAARTWERMALIKARPVAGNMSLGKSFLKELQTIIYRKFVDYSVLSEIRSMKEKILAETHFHFLMGDDIKLGPGGIREIEFMVQALQMVFGGKLPAIREKNTLKALDKLKEGKLISEAECRQLHQGYVFLRTLEHRLQMVHQRQTHSLPKDSESLGRIARTLPFKGKRKAASTQGMLGELDRVRSQVRIAFDNLLLATNSVSQDHIVKTLETLGTREDWERELTSLGFQRWSRAQEIIESWHLKIRSLSGIEKGYWVKLLPFLLGYCLQSVNPDQALAFTDRFLRSIGGRTGILAMLLERSALAKEIVDLFARSAMMGRLFVQNPEMMDHLALQRTIGRPKVENGFPKNHGVRERVKDPEEHHADLRRWKNSLFLGTALEEISGRVSSTETSERLTLLADRVLLETTSLAEEILIREVIHPFYPDRASSIPLSPFCILGMGKLGGNELGYASDLDLIFIYSLKASFLEEPKNSRMRPGSQGEKKRITCHEYLVRLAQRLISYLSLPLKEGPGYLVDARLRPSGSFGPLIVTLESFQTYYQTQAQNWEKQALTKARVIVGPKPLRDQVQRVIDEIVFGVPPDPQVKGEIAHLRMRMEKERSGEDATHFNPKLGYGGLTDIEFIAQYLQWIYGRSDPKLREPNTLKALKVLESSGTVSVEVHYVLKEAYQFLTALDHGLQLLYDRKGDPRTYSLEELALTAKLNLMGLGEASIPAWDILNHYEKIRKKVRSIFNQIFY